MKINLKFLLLVFTAIAMVLPSCSSDEDNTYNLQQTTLQKMYPKATNIKWENERGYSVADFINGELECEAWFDTSGKWHMTETDIPFMALPEAVKIAFNTGEYADWLIDDVDMVERLGIELLYTIKVERGPYEYDLFYSADGRFMEFVKESKYYDYFLFEELSETVAFFISERYPNAKLAHFVIMDNLIQETFYIDLIDGTIPRKILFRSKDGWFNTISKLHYTDLPESIVIALQKSKYGEYPIEEINNILSVEETNNSFYVLQPENFNEDYGGSGIFINRNGVSMTYDIPSHKS